MAEDFEWWLTFPKEVVAERLDYWLRFPRVKMGYVRCVDPDGAIIAEVPTFHLYALLEGLDTPHRFYRRAEWRAFIRDVVRDRALLDLPCSTAKN